MHAPKRVKQNVLQKSVRVGKCRVVQREMEQLIDEKSVPARRPTPGSLKLEF